MKNLSVSIVTATFNHVKYLEETILSVKNQNYPYLEHIIVDGGSTDGTIEILKHYESQYNMKWISEKDEGIADGLNKGFKIAKGNIFCWLDSDDTYLLGTIKKVVDIFQKQPQVDLVFGDILIINDKSKKINYIKFTDFDFETWAYEGGSMNPSAAFWRRELHEKIGGLNKKYMWSPDIYFFTEVGALGAKFYHIKDFLASYRHHHEQILGNKKYIRNQNSIFNIKQRERKEIFKEYINKLSKEELKKKKQKVLFKRMLRYIKQGDIYYVMRGFLKRANILQMPNKNNYD
ncbi:MAG: glycosyltransferase family 2 protein [Candidatus Nealsonbacteria bacterium]